MEGVVDHGPMYLANPLLGSPSGIVDKVCEFHRIQATGLNALGPRSLVRSLAVVYTCASLCGPV
jgi:hypothetical protein